MNKRIAKKTVKNHEAKKGNTPWDRLVRAFRRLGRKVPEAREIAADVADKAEGAFSEVQEAVEAVDDAVGEVRETVDYAKMKVAELKALAKKRGVKGFSKMKKAELIKALGLPSGA